ncbi:hypothetical protein [Massilia phyllosphaerae]|uniref:hypothetical protein n=1 Tax=Massilia phyllosphaerae TaxID=3106034 RepID=UPI002B1CC56F|nr:hypothetical protein [Massilia sp. SGZ-792]
MPIIPREQIAGLALFYDAAKAISTPDEIPILEIRSNDISLLQGLSKNTMHQGVCIVLGVSYQKKKLVAMHFLPDLKSNPKPSFADSPDSAIYIDNNADPEYVVSYLRDISNTYDSLKAPKYQIYDDGDETVPRDELIKENAISKYEHEKFMRKYFMHFHSIPFEYK